MTAPSGQQGLTAQQLAVLVALVTAQAHLRGQLTDAAVAAASAPFRALTAADWWSPPAVDRAVAAATRIVQATQTQAARITSGYVARAASTMTGKTVTPVGAVNVRTLRRDITPVTARSLVDGTVRSPFLILGDTHDGPAPGINTPATMAVPDPRPGTILDRVRAQLAAEAAALDPAVPYQRVAEQYRYQVSARGVDPDKAADSAVVRIGAVAHTDVTLAVREQVRASLGEIPGVTGYRRILRPELSKTGPCGLCVVAADRVYHVKDLQPIHDRCCCETLPIIGSLDPGLTLNAADLEALYGAAGSTGGGKGQGGALKRIRVALAENGELGPVLVDADQAYRGPVDVARLKVDDAAVRLQAQLDSLERQFGVLSRRSHNGEDVDRPLAWHENRIAELRRELATV